MDGGVAFLHLGRGRNLGQMLTSATLPSLHSFPSLSTLMLSPSFSLFFLTLPGSPSLCYDALPVGCQVTGETVSRVAGLVGGWKGSLVFLAHVHRLFGRLTAHAP